MSKLIGMVLDSNLLLQSHIRETIHKARRGVEIIRYLSRYVSRIVLDLVYKAYVRPIIIILSACGVLPSVDLSSPVSFWDPFGLGVSTIGTISLDCVCALIILNLTGDTAEAGQVLLPGELKKSPFLCYEVLLPKV